MTVSSVALLFVVLSAVCAGAAASSGAISPQLECALCGLAVNEIEGLVQENKTSAQIIQAIEEDICSHLSGDLKALCDQIAQLAPVIVDKLIDHERSSTICIGLKLCAGPRNDRPDPITMPKRATPSLFCLFPLLSHLCAGIVNLDLPPEQRWVEPLQPFIATFNEILSIIDKLLPATTPKLDALGTLIAGFLGQPYQDEMKGVAKALNTSLGIVAIVNLGYEVSAFCTSIVAQATDGSVYHARNLDFGEGMGFTDILRNLTFEVDFQSGGVTQYSCVTYASFVGCLTGVRPSGWAVTVNTRFPPDGEHRPFKQLWKELVEAITVKGSQVNSQLIRDALASTAKFADAKDILSNHPLIAQVYLTISGAAPGEGCVITRNMTGADDVWCLDAPNGRWYVLETNYDHWKPVSPPCCSASLPRHARVAGAVV
jgi:N-acylethanolamine-hydrolysing acid amidase